MNSLKVTKKLLRKRNTELSGYLQTSVNFKAVYFTGKCFMANYYNITKIIYFKTVKVSFQSLCIERDHTYINYRCEQIQTLFYK